MTLLDFFVYLVASTFDAIVYPFQQIINVITYNALYFINPIISLIENIIELFNLIYNLCVNFVTAVYDTRIAGMLVVMFGVVLVFRIYSIVHGKTFSAAIFGWEIGFTFP